MLGHRARASLHSEFSKRVHVVFYYNFHAVMFFASYLVFKAKGLHHLIQVI